MDASEGRAGNTIYFPVNVPGALLFLGDGHAAQGDGEAAGTGIEVPLRARVQVDLLKKKSLRWPRFESDQKLMTVGAYRPLDDALRIALSGLVAWIHADYGFSELDAYELLTKVAPLHLAEMSTQLRDRRGDRQAVSAAEAVRGGGARTHGGRVQGAAERTQACSRKPASELSERSLTTQTLKSDRAATATGSSVSIGQERSPSAERSTKPLFTLIHNRHSFTTLTCAGNLPAP
jgi:hypothetical protein